MYYKIILSNTSETISIREDELKAVLDKIAKGEIAITSGGIFNPSYFVGIIEDKERERIEIEKKLYKLETDESSSFAKLLSPKKKMLTDDVRTEIDEEIAKEERKLK